MGADTMLLKWTWRSARAACNTSHRTDLARCFVANIDLSVPQELPEFPAPEGEARSMTFKRVLLNTCQEEFEGAHQARAVRLPMCLLPHEDPAAQIGL